MTSLLHYSSTKDNFAFRPWRHARESSDFDSMSPRHTYEATQVRPCVLPTRVNTHTRGASAGASLLGVRTHDTSRDTPSLLIIQRVCFFSTQ